jgi:hypothetical protein
LFAHVRVLAFARASNIKDANIVLVCPRGEFRWLVTKIDSEFRLVVLDAKTDGFARTAFEAIS